MKDEGDAKSGRDVPAERLYEIGSIYFGEINRDRVLCKFNLLVQLLELSEVVRRSEIVVADF